MIVAMPSTPRSPSQEMLDTRWARVARVRILRGGVHRGRPLTGEVLTEIAEPGELGRLRDLLAIEDGGDAVCACAGQLAFELQASDGEVVAVLGFHHGVAIRWDAWHADAVLVDGLGVLRWLDDHGVTEPLQAYEQAQARARKSAALEREWLAAAPAAVAHLGPSLVEVSRTGAGVERVARDVAAVLEEAEPDGVARARALLRWFGAGTGRTSGFPLHESIPEAVLLAMEPSTLDAALDDPGDDAARRGASRLVSGWRFTKRYGKDRLWRGSRPR
jgi:hypothetical protein